MTCPRRFAVVVTFLAFACGGQTHGDPASAGGGTTGGDGGGAAQGAAAGMGGTGATTGAGGTSPENTVGAMAAAVCIAMSDSQCSIEWCLADFVLKEKQAKAYDCLVELSAFLNCTMDHPLVCIDGDAGPAFYDHHPDCATQYQTLSACLPECGVSSGNEGCAIHCDAKIPWEAACTKSAEWTHCVCTKGQKAGTEADIYIDQSCFMTQMRQALEALCL